MVLPHFPVVRACYRLFFLIYRQFKKSDSSKKHSTKRIESVYRQGQSSLNISMLNKCVYFWVTYFYVHLNRLQKTIFWFWWCTQFGGCWQVFVVCWKVQTGSQEVWINCSNNFCAFLSFTSCHHKPKRFYFSVNVNSILQWLINQNVWAAVKVWAISSETLQ